VLFSEYSVYVILQTILLTDAKTVFPTNHVASTSEPNISANENTKKTSTTITENY